MRIRDVMKELNLSQRRVERLIISGQIETQRKRGVHYISIDSFEKYLANQKAKGKKVNELNVINSVIDDGLETGVNWVNIKDFWESPEKAILKLGKPLNVVDLFCGAGGFTKGFELAGMESICGMDWCKNCGKTYRRNFEHPFIEGDISLSETKEALYKTVQNALQGEPLNVLTGGFPCQGFSLSGSRVVEDPRNSLYKEMLEIVNELKPEFVVMENVKGLRSMLKGKVEKKIIADYKEAGYTINVTTLLAANYGVPQKRERLIFIGNRIGAKNLHPKPFLKEKDFVTTKEAIEDLMNLPDDKSINHVRTRHRKDMIPRLAAVPEGKSLYPNYVDSWRKCQWNEASCTIKENHGGVNIHPIVPRVITVREMARLQSFPDDFIFEGPKTRQLVQLGNAVPPLMAKAVALAIVKAYAQ